MSDYVDKADAWDAVCAAGAEIKRLKARLNEHEQLLDEAAAKLETCRYSELPLAKKIRTHLDASKPIQTAPEGLSEWGGWDQSRPPWGEAKHKDAVLYELFRGPWSAEDAATLIRFINRTWGKFAPKAERKAQP